MAETKVIFLLIATLSLSVGQLGAVSFSIDATSGTPAFPDDILLPGGPIIGIPGMAGGGGPDVNGFSYGYAHTSEPLVAGFGFSVDRTSAGLFGTAVFLESGGVPAPGDQSSDIYGATIAFPGMNTHLHDGDGVFPPGGPAAGVPLGLFEPGGTDNVDGMDFRSPIGPSIFWTGDALSMGPASADVFISPSAPFYAGAGIVYAPAGVLGLIPIPVGGDDIDALVVFEDGVAGFGPGDTIYLSLAPGSPTLGILGVGPEDILMATLAGGTVPLVPGGALGLGPGDNLNALDVTFIPEPAVPMLFGIAGFALLLRRRK